MRKMFTILFLFLPIITFAPELNEIVLPLRSEIKPFEALSHAVVIVESGGDNNALNRKEMAVGAFQIRPIRIKDYNMRTGKNYKLCDMYDYDKAKEVFMYYACRLMDPETIARRWNGSGPMTTVYWNKVKQLL